MRAGSAAAGRAGKQLTLQQLIAQRQAERRTVTLIYSNGRDHATGHFRAVAKLAMRRRLAALPSTERAREQHRIKPVSAPATAHSSRSAGALSSLKWFMQRCLRL
jgi:hypothetical protein